MGQKFQSLAYSQEPYLLELKHPVKGKEPLKSFKNLEDYIIHINGIFK